MALDYKEGLQCDALRALGRRGGDRVSVTDRAAVDGAMEGVEFVFHLAAAFRELNVPNSFYDEVNVSGTRNVLRGRPRRRGCASSSTAAPAASTATSIIRPADEDAPIQPADYYQRTKYEAEPLVASSLSAGSTAVILRPAAIYGPGDPERFFMIFKRVARGTFPMFGNGQTLYHPLYIDNLVDAFILCHGGRAWATAGLPHRRRAVPADRGRWCRRWVGRWMWRSGSRTTRSGRSSPSGHVVEKVCRPFGITPPIFPRRVDWYRQNRAFDIDKAKRELGYAPKVGSTEGLRRTGDWYRRMGYLT